MGFCICFQAANNCQHLDNAGRGIDDMARSLLAMPINMPVSSEADRELV
jgi:hypothetical protein